MDSYLTGRHTVLFTARTETDGTYCPQAVIAGRGPGFPSWQLGPVGELPMVPRRYFYRGADLYSTHDFTLARGGGCIMVVFEQSFPVYSMTGDGRVRGRIGGQDLVLIVGNMNPDGSFFVPRGTSLADLDREPCIKTFFSMIPRHRRSAAVWESYRQAARLAVADNHDAEQSAVLRLWNRDMANACTCPAGSHTMMTADDDDDDDDENNDINSW